VSEESQLRSQVCCCCIGCCQVGFGVTLGAFLSAVSLQDILLQILIEIKLLL